MAGDEDRSSRGSVLGMLTGGAIATGGPVMLVAVGVLFLGLFSPRSRTGDVPPSSTPRDPGNLPAAPDRFQEGHAGMAIETLQPFWSHIGLGREARRAIDAARGEAGGGPSEHGGSRPVPSAAPSPEGVAAGVGSKADEHASPDRLAAERLRAFRGREDVRRLADAVDVQVLIAMLPDPIETGSKYEFDMGLEAIQKAVESEGFLMDRFSNPWGRVAGTDADSTLYRKEPGCLVFRAGDDEFAYASRQSLMVLLVVGESNAKGIYRGAMRTALDCAEALSPADGKGRRTLRIVGPSYSGTAGALARTLGNWLEGHDSTDIWVCSGAATSVEKDRFEAAATPIGGAPGRVVYSATVLPDDLLFDAVTNHLADPTGEGRQETPQKTVVLVESGTLFGNRLFRRIEGLNKHEDAWSPYLFIPFPRRLAQLRDIPTLNQGVELAIDPRSRENLPLAESGDTMELFPGFDKAMAEWTDSEVITHILQTIRGERARNVGVFASEVRNVLFLVRLINQHCPDVQVFLINNDLLFTYRTFAPEFYGAIVASTYPLNAPSQSWSFPNKGHSMRRLFANETDIGRYNATLVLINAERDPADAGHLRLRGQAEDMLVYGPPFEKREASDPSRASSRKRPCAWISLVGKDQSWPLRTVTIDDLLEKANRPSGELPGLPRRVAPPAPLAPGGAAGVPRPFDASATFRLGALVGAAKDAAESLRTVAGDPNDPAPRPEPEGPVASRFPSLLTLRADAEAGARDELARLRAGKKGPEAKGKPDASRPDLRPLLGALAGLGRLASVTMDDANFDPAWRAAAGRYWEQAAVLGHLWPEFEIRRTTIGSPLERLETEMNWLNSLLILDRAVDTYPDSLFTDARKPRPEDKPRRFSESQSALLAAIRRLSDQVRGPRSAGTDPSLTPKQRREKELDGGAADLLTASLKHSVALKSLMDGISLESSAAEPKPGPEGPGRQEPALHTRWYEYRAARTVLEAALLYREACLAEIRGGPRDLKTPRDTVADDIRDQVAWIDAVLADPEGFINGGSASRMIDRLALSSSRREIANRSKDLVPEVIDVEKEYAEVAVHGGNPALLAPAAKAEAAPLFPGIGAENPVASVISAMPLSYYASLSSWVVLAWYFAIQLLYQSCKSARDGGVANWLSVYGEKARERRIFTFVLALAMLLVLGFLSRPLLAILPGAYSHMIGVMLAVVTAAFIIWEVYEIHDRWWPLVTMGGLLLGPAWLWILIHAYKPAGFRVGLVVASCETTMFMLATFLAWTSGAAKPVIRENNRTRVVPRAAARFGTWLLFVVACLIFWMSRPEPGRESLFAASRLPHMGSGVSPLPTAFWLGLLFALWSLNRMKGLSYALQLPPEGSLERDAERALSGWPAGESMWADEVKRAAAQLDALAAAEREPEAPALGLLSHQQWWWRLSRTSRMVFTIVFLLLLSVCVTAPYWWSPLSPTSEGRWFDWLLLVALIIYLALYLDAFSRLWGAWHHLREALQTMRSLPLQAAIERLPGQVCDAFGRFTGPALEPEFASTGPLDRAGRRYAVEVARSLNPDRKGFAPWLRRSLGRSLIGPEEDACRPVLARLHRDAMGLLRDQGDPARIRAMMWACLPFVVAGWDQRTPRSVFGHGSDGGEPARNGGPSGPQRRRADGGTATAMVTTASARAVEHPTHAGWLELAEDFTLIATIRLLKKYAAPIRSLGAFLMLSPILLMFAVTSYPFQPHRTLTLIVWSLVIAAPMCTSYVFVQIDRDPFVSRLSRTVPNRVNFDASMIVKLAPIAVPVIGLILAAFPNLSFWLREVLQPLLVAVK